MTACGSSLTSGDRVCCLQSSKKWVPRSTNPDCSTGFEDQLLLLSQRAIEAGLIEQQQFPSPLPGQPTVAAFHKLMSSTLRSSNWQTAAHLALWCTSSHPSAAQDGLLAAFAGARQTKQDLGLTADQAFGAPSACRFWTACTRVGSRWQECNLSSIRYIHFCLTSAQTTCLSAY